MAVWGTVAFSLPIRCISEHFLLVKTQPVISNPVGSVIMNFRSFFVGLSHSLISSFVKGLLQ